MAVIPNSLAQEIKISSHRKGDLPNDEALFCIGGKEAPRR
jgi:hypothetical protein